MSRKNFKQVFSPFLLVCVLSAFAIVWVANAQDKPATAGKQPIDYSSIITRLKEQLPEQMARLNVPGLAIAMVDGEKLVWAEGFGYTDRSNQTKVTADTLFSLQSISKTYTAAGFLIAIEKGWMKLDDPLQKHMPKFTVQSPFGTDEANKITFRHLLSHWAGFTHEAPCGNNFDDRDCAFADHIRSVSESWLKFPVGQRYSYSNLGIDLVGYCLELRSRKPFDRFMQDEVFSPLGMTSSTFSHKEAANNPLLAKGHVRERTLPVTPIPMIPSGSMYSTVKDMAKFISFHLNGGKVNGKQIIGEGLLKEMVAPQFPVQWQVGGYGLGIASQPWSQGGRLLNHNGGGYGYSTSQWWIPEHQVGIVILTNAAQGGAMTGGTTERVLQQMIEAKYGYSPRGEPIRFTDKPVITVEAGLLQRLEGTYKPRGGIMTFKVKEGILYTVSGSIEVKLSAHSPTEFTVAGRKYTFDLSKEGKPKGVQMMNISGVEYMPINDRPDDEAGPNKKEWQNFVGEYSGNIYGDANKTNVTIKNGYLYVSWQGGLRLIEYKPGLFFTADGEAVIFQSDRMSLGNRPFLKENPTKP